MKRVLNVNGFEYEAEYSEAEISTILKPLLKRMTDIYIDKNERIIVFLAAPPAVGKSTLALFLECISQEEENLIEMQSLSLDGFHHKSEYLENYKISYLGDEIPLKDIKGMPETFDFEKFLTYLKNLKTRNENWPIYDRQKHDVVDDALKITKNIVLIEGNWLLLDEDQWSQLVSYCDYSIFIEADESILKERLINRKIRGGLSYETALEFYERSDKKNIQRVLKNRVKADINLSIEKIGDKLILKK